jgi:regulatory protein SWI6
VFQNEMKAKQHAVKSLHASLRTTSSQLGEARRALDTLEEKAKIQQQSRQKVMNLSRARDEEQFRVMELEQARGHAHSDPSIATSWEIEVESLTSTPAPSLGNESLNGTSLGDLPSLPFTIVLRARINALRLRTAETRQAEQALKSRSREIELKFRRLVALATKCSDADVDNHLDGLMRAVESEKGELEIGRVRRFLGGVEGVVH